MIGADGDGFRGCGGVQLAFSAFDDAHASLTSEVAGRGGKDGAFDDFQLTGEGDVLLGDDGTHKLYWTTKLVSGTGGTALLKDTGRGRPGGRPADQGVRPTGPTAVREQSGSTGRDRARGADWCGSPPSRT